MLYTVEKSQLVIFLKTEIVLGRGGRTASRKIIKRENEFTHNERQPEVRVGYRHFG